MPSLFFLFSFSALLICIDKHIGFSQFSPFPFQLPGLKKKKEKEEGGQSMTVKHTGAGD